MKKNSLFFALAFLLCPLLIATTEAPVRSLGGLTTEQSHPTTAELSKTMRSNIVEGLRLLHLVDQGVVSAFDYFVAKHYPEMRADFMNAVLHNKKCYLVGAGSSGRVAIDLAARDVFKTVVDVMAGGDSALIRAREGFEDSQEDGQRAMEAFDLGPNDMVVLISASGSALFNIGAGIAARKKDAKVYYFCNSKTLPAETTTFITDYGVTPVVVDNGPQAITGSTRLQAATLALLCLGIVCLDQNPVNVREHFITGNEVIAKNLEAIAHIVEAEAAVFSAPAANFNKVTDETDQGYVTSLATKEYARSVTIDSVEIPPTFCTNPPCRNYSEKKRRPEYESFVIGAASEGAAWKILLGRDISPRDTEAVREFSIGPDGFRRRPKGAGNLVIGVAGDEYKKLLPALNQAQTDGARTALIVLSSRAIDKEAVTGINHPVFLEHVPNDERGLNLAIILKQVLNMISNGTMVMMGRVDGNSMIACNATNNKLVDRASRLVSACFEQRKLTCSLEKHALEVLIKQIVQGKKRLEERGMGTPPPVTIAVTMILKSVDFEGALSLLAVSGNNLDAIFES
jgi:N-acetylmuramic acid 6-phosphate (MurNAc-6-P) etherase